MGGGLKSDPAVHREPAFAAVYRKASGEGFAQGPAGCARDTVPTMGRRPFGPGAVGVPVDPRCGEEDAGRSPDAGVGPAARIPGAVRRLVPGVGGAVPWTRSEQILRTPLGRARPSLPRFETPCRAWAGTAGPRAAGARTSRAAVRARWMDPPGRWVVIACGRAGVPCRPA